MKVALRADAIAQLKTGWIIEGSKNIHLTYVRAFNWPVEHPTKGAQTAVFCLAWDGATVEPRVFISDSDLDIYAEAQVGGKSANTTPPDRDDLDVHVALTLESSGKISKFTAETMDELGNLLADSYFDEEETIQTLQQFKAQSGYQKLSYFLQKPGPQIEYIITN